MTLDLVADICKRHQVSILFNLFGINYIIIDVIHDKIQLVEIIFDLIYSEIGSKGLTPGQAAQKWCNKVEPLNRNCRSTNAPSPAPEHHGYRDDIRPMIQKNNRMFVFVSMNMSIVYTGVPFINFILCQCQFLNKAKIQWILVSFFYTLEGSLEDTP